jgi:hypothetical protein
MSAATYRIYRDSVSYVEVAVNENQGLVHAILESGISNPDRVTCRVSSKKTPSDKTSIVMIYRGTDGLFRVPTCGNDSERSLVWFPVTQGAMARAIPIVKALEAIQPGATNGSQGWARAIPIVKALEAAKASGMDMGLISELIPA